MKKRAEETSFLLCEPERKTDVSFSHLETAEREFPIWILNSKRFTFSALPSEMIATVKLHWFCATSRGNSRANLSLTLMCILDWQLVQKLHIPEGVLYCDNGESCKLYLKACCVITTVKNTFLMHHASPPGGSRGISMTASSLHSTCQPPHNIRVPAEVTGQHNSRSHHTPLLYGNSQTLTSTLSIYI